MSLRDRSYWRDDQDHFGGGVQVVRPQFPKAVKYLLIINVAVYVVQVFLDQPKPAQPAGLLSSLFGVTVEGFWQIWRYLTFQFLHGDAWHLFFNMLALFFLGPVLERHWGTKRFVKFYLSCGIVAGLAYVVIGALYGLPGDMPIIGASGGVYGILLACAVLFPRIKLLLFFIVPISIRILAGFIFGAMALVVLRALAQGQAYAAMSDVAHLGGAAAAAFWLWALPPLREGAVEGKAGSRRGAWQRKMKKRQANDEEIDRILEKIKQEGINSLTSRERQKLQEATRKQHEEQRELYRL